MQIVIDITEDYYNAIKSIPDMISTADMLLIKYGTPLPKGHGDLVDRDKIIEGLAAAVPWAILDERDSAYMEGMDRAKIEVDDAPTVIQADKETE